MMRPLYVAALVALTALPAQAEKLSLSAISAYLNGLKTAEATFTQYNADGTQSEGTVYIRRPGRMRFEYAAPDRTLVLASGGQVAIFDGKTRQPPEQYPLAKTPLNLILAAKVDLSRAKMVVGHEEAEGLTVVTAQDPDHPEYGTLALAFSEGPVSLRQWAVTDQTGGKTIVTLGPLETGKAYGASLFSITDEVARGKRRK
jgi:outer membrane lipoprotein-sorting protein